MTRTAGNKHATRSAQTRERFIAAAQKLYAERSIDSVSLNEITVAAGQKNRNALQYHFGSRDGLLQAILDYHSEQVSALRTAFFDNHMDPAWSDAEASARLLILPIARYLEQNPEGSHYVKIQSQLAAISNNVTNPDSQSRLSFRDEPNLYRLMTGALSHLGKAEMQRRVFLVVSITFHSIADICRAADMADAATPLKQRDAMFEQLVGIIADLVAAPARD